jgi:purine-binding chemotaxis protein CheW
MKKSASASCLQGNYLIVRIANERYGIPVDRVREIIRHQKVTPIPHQPAYIKGMINLRGRVIPIVDLRVKFGVSAEFDARTCVIVARIERQRETALQIGLVVSGVEDVVGLENDQIDPMPPFLDGPGCFLGIAKIEEDVRTLMDVDRVLDPGMLQELTSPAP